MEYNISDLLDSLQEETVSIQLCSSASAKRIRAKTMQKIHAGKKGRRGLQTLLKIAVAAAVIVTLALPVMAATGFRFTDWLEGLEKKDIAEEMQHYTSWENTEGFWQVGLLPEKVTPEGMTLNIREVQDSPVSGSLVIHGGYWLEKWNGEAFEVMTPSAAAQVEESREIQDGTRFETEINWTEAYGRLDSGRYRLGKDFSYTYSDGRTVELQDWAEFRIFNGEMAPYIAQCVDAMEALRKQDSYHVFWTVNSFSLDMEVMERFDFETWKSGEDYLLRNGFQEFYMECEDGQIREAREGAFGEFLRGGEGFTIHKWNSCEILDGVESWEYDYLLSEELNRFTVWASSLKIQEANVGEIWVEENQIGLISTYYPSENQVNHEEVIFTFDEAGKITRVECYKLPQLYCSQEEKIPTGTLTVQDSTAAEIEAVLDAQNVGTPDTFSWAEEKQQEGKTSGFVNTTPVTIETGYDAFMRALNDYDVVAKTHHASRVSYDAEAEMWKVDFWWAYGNVHGIVYLNSQGITQLTILEPYE